MSHIAPMSHKSVFIVQNQVVRRCDIHCDMPKIYATYLGGLSTLKNGIFEANYMTYESRRWPTDLMS